MAYWNGGGAVIERPREDDWSALAAVPSIIPTLPREFAGNLSLGPRPQIPNLSRCPEIDCVRHLLPEALVAAAELRAALLIKK
jgi:hypothetical protein